MGNSWKKHPSQPQPLWFDSFMTYHISSFALLYCSSEPPDKWIYIFSYDIIIVLFPYSVLIINWICREKFAYFAYLIAFLLNFKRILTLNFFYSSITSSVVDVCKLFCKSPMELFVEFRIKKQLQFFNRNHVAMYLSQE